MSVDRESDTGSEARRSARAVLCTSALVKSSGRPLSHHVTYDLSSGGVRLCGLPLAEMGERVEVLLYLPDGRLRLDGELKRAGSSGDRPDFAVEFGDLSVHVEATIQRAVDEALAEPKRRRVLLYDENTASQSGHSGHWGHWAGWSWLEPLRPLCVAADSGVAAVEQLEGEQFELALVRKTEATAQLPAWAEAYPELSWVGIDAAGRLHPIATSFGTGCYGP